MPPHPVATLTDALLEWFERTRRKLPWRASRTPYRVLVSEVMLQQTQVATVVPYFERWLARFPDVQTLADAPLDDALKLWEGLGYYRRARNLHRAAQLVAQQGGVFPTDYQGWLSLPGVGPYTAAALASIVNGESVVAVDGNVKRVSARLFVLEGEVKPEVAREHLEPLLPQGRPGDFNEALMELGATVCTPKRPTCQRCPLSAYCLAYQTGRVEALPTPKTRAAIPHRVRYAVVDVQDEKIWLRQRGADEMLSGLWGFALLEELPPNAQTLPPVTHAYTHFSTAVTPVLTTSRGLEGAFVPTSDLDALALSTLDRKILSGLRDAGILTS